MRGPGRREGAVAALKRGSGSGRSKRGGSGWRAAALGEKSEMRGEDSESDTEGSKMKSLLEEGFYSILSKFS